MDFFKTGWVYHWDESAIERGRADNIGSIRSGEIVPSNPESVTPVCQANHYYTELMTDREWYKKLLQVIFQVATCRMDKDEKVFKWLDYIPGVTPRLGNLHKDDWVLSGPMSGCPIVRFKAASRDSWSCAHIGTAATDPINNRMVKNKFCEFLLTSREMVTEEVQGFYPSAAIDEDALVDFLKTWGLLGRTRTEIYVCMSKDKCYAITLCKVPLKGAGSIFWLCGPIKECPVLSKGELMQALRKPRKEEAVYEGRHGGVGSLEQEIRRRMREREREAIMLSSRP